jgi:hypothetical protein
MDRRESTMTRALLVMVMVAAFAIRGCSDDPAAVGSFARSAPSSGLSLKLKLPSIGPAGADGRAAAAPVKAIATQLSLEIGATGAPDTITPPPFPISGPPGQLLSFTVGNITPGLRKPVSYRATDGSGGIVSRGSYLVDFYPGQVSSNDLDLGLAGNPTGGSSRMLGHLIVTLMGNAPPVTGPNGALVEVDLSRHTYRVISTNFVTPPHSVAFDTLRNRYVVTEFGAAGAVVAIDPATGARTELAGSLPNARGILAIPGGPYVVAIEGANFRKLIVIDPDSGAVVVSYTYPDSSPPTGIPIALAPDLTGGILVAEQYAVGYEGGISNFTGSPTSVVRTDVFSYGNYPPLAQVVCTGVAKDPRTGEIFVAEKESPLMPSGNRIVSIVPGTAPGFGARTVLHDYGTIALGECVLGPGGGIYVAETSGDALGLILPDRTRALEIQLPANSQPRGLLLLP